ncbi:MAG: hypothetical protein KME28_09570 [Pelatocladus maniniholoensis HA4357-MV3]|jgi:hypothetical protein|uniref:DUF1795 domain-containing protein n=1 Tax=Pelatocladus maniniholoensis HA4357-MV3 TaxID=1117104 RepID=A0A9E3H6M4_9NOST|nr:hypothetical protein [Pelatocladus maniniholoensis HA4357-MV3]BAZ69045.1 hypothetical protein NIES4106_38140 [Fischerella sp. NIES-4106]
MAKRVLLFLITTALLCSGFTRVEARPPQRPLSPTKPAPNKPIKSEWKLFTAPDGSFTVLMPGMPKVITQTQKTYMGEINLQVFVGQLANQEVAYIVAYNDFPHSYGQMTNPQLILNNAQILAVKTTQSNLIGQRRISSSNGHPGKEIEYVNSGGKITKNRMYVADGRLYQVMAIATKKQQHTLSQTINGYLNSFQLVLKK